MECPRCGKQTKTEESRQTLHCTQFRLRKCYSCNLKFKSSEKPIFTSLPSDIQQRFLESGERSGWWTKRK